ncbi:hypothetical protein [Actinoplanes palleronii]|uniref:Uncharacterized protein n=1 Tax=Actinoplanes palleronii TaxID=113570 RepID=A0ABQ4BTD9_9ACTN|nr:hypothetical protein [Actinoplanes palleronii]GIE73922.1 hypothetical protein Apa02nite_100300 [Actinoplanes palleronii]
MSTLNGLPAHILLVHAIVVLLPLTAGLLVLTAFWPAARRRLAGPNALLALVVLVLVPITTSAGEWLEGHIASNALVEAHAELGDTAIFATVPVVILTLIVWWREREASAAALVPMQPAQPPGTTRAGTAATTLTSPVRARRVLLAPASRVVTIVITVCAILAAGAAVYDTYRIGDSGAKATWQGEFNSVPAGDSAEPGGK